LGGGGEAKLRERGVFGIGGKHRLLKKRTGTSWGFGGGGGG